MKGFRRRESEVTVNKDDKGSWLQLRINARSEVHKPCSCRLTAGIVGKLIKNCNFVLNLSSYSRKV